ncbi:MAG: ATP synthase F1 subunit delta [Gemmatimonadota bacterium]|nr:MAG: ATP synthase F1 subunit delta [Gemmatimonadota bacterium]
MRERTIARNYAEALFEAGERAGQTERYADLVEALAGAIRSDDHIRQVLDSPRVPKPTKEKILARALAGHAPEQFIKFLAAVVKRGRQGIMVAISEEYLGLVDAKFNRIHAGVLLAREPDAAFQQVIKRKLSEAFGKEVIAHYRADPEILGGLIVRIGDRIMDGSVRRRMVSLRRQLLGS